MKTLQASVTSTAAPVLEPKYTLDVTVKNISSTTLFVGNVSVTKDNGYQLKQDEWVHLELNSSDPLYAVTASGTATLAVVYNKETI